MVIVETHLVVSRVLVIQGSPSMHEDIIVWVSQSKLTYRYGKALDKPILFGRFRNKFLYMLIDILHVIWSIIPYISPLKLHQK